MDEILQLIGLSCLPDRLLLVQTDYNDVFQFYPEFNQFPRRFNQTQTLQRCVKRSGIEGLVASYPARGVVGVFLCTGQESSSEEKVITEKIRELAKDQRRGGRECCDWDKPILQQPVAFPAGLCRV